MKRNLITLLTVAVMLVLALPVAAAPSETTGICGEPAVFTLWGGKTIDVGTVTVWNDETNLYIKYDTKDGWLLKEVQLYVLDSEPMERLTPGQAPYKSGDISYATSYTFTVPLDVECGATKWLQAHAAVVMLDEFGNEIQGETAYGGNITDPGQGSWYGNIAYVVQCCEEPPAPCYAFMDETAWAAGSRYVAKGNWATFTPYAEGTVDLFAGQTMDVGDVTFSAVVDGMVTISISLDAPWELNPDTYEAVKIQGYDAAPSGNPSPGLFTTYKGNETTVTVPAYAVYGVHVDVGYWMEVECPVE